MRTSDDSAGYGAILLSLPAPPEIGLDVRVAGGEVTRVPFFRDELERVLKRTLVDEYLWPRRMVLPADEPGAIGVPVLSPAQLEELARDDPLLRAERALAEQPAVGALQEDRRALESRTDANFTINLGVLPDFGSLNLTDVLANLQGELTDFRSFGNFTDTQVISDRLFADIAELGDTFGNLDFGDQKLLVERVANLTNQTELVERLANLTDLVDFAELAELGEQLQEEGRRRFGDAYDSAPWWRLGWAVGQGETSNVSTSNGSAAPWWRFGYGTEQDVAKNAAVLAVKGNRTDRVAANSTPESPWLRWGGGNLDGGGQTRTAANQTESASATASAAGWRIGWGGLRLSRAPSDDSGDDHTGDGSGDAGNDEPTAAKSEGAEENENEVEAWIEAALSAEI